MIALMPHRRIKFSITASVKTCVFVNSFLTALGQVRLGYKVPGPALGRVTENVRYLLLFGWVRHIAVRYNVLLAIRAEAPVQVLLHFAGRLTKGVHEKRTGDRVGFV